MNKFGAKTLSIARYHIYTVLLLSIVLIVGFALSLLTH
jgi:hypothetical protein